MGNCKFEITHCKLIVLRPDLRRTLWESTTGGCPSPPPPPAKGKQPTTEALCHPPPPSSNTAWGGGGLGGVRALYICIQLYIDVLSPTNPLIPSIALSLLSSNTSPAAAILATRPCLLLMLTLQVLVLLLLRPLLVCIGGDGGESHPHPAGQPPCPPPPPRLPAQCTMRSAAVPCVAFAVPPTPLPVLQVCAAAQAWGAAAACAPSGR